MVEICIGENLVASITVDNILEKYQDKLAKLGYIIGPKLGEGTQGVAFLLQNGRVLKITEDNTEAIASNDIAGKKLNNVCEIDRVFSFASDTSIYRKYFIVQEKLTIKKEDKIIFGIAREKLKGYYQQWYTLISTEHLGKLSDIVKNNKNDFTPKEYSLLEDIIEGLTSLDNEFIKYGDVHPGNLGRDASGNLKIFDLGYSFSLKRNPIEALESIYMKISNIIQIL